MRTSWIEMIRKIEKAVGLPVEVYADLVDGNEIDDAALSELIVEVYADLVDGNSKAGGKGGAVLVEVYADLVDGNTLS